MASGWRIIDCTGLSGRIKSARGAIIVHPDEAPEQSFPVADLAVVLIGMKVSISAAAIHRLNGADVAVLFCDWRGVPEGASYNWSSHTRVGARNIAQANVSLPRKKALWGTVIKAKIYGQAASLKNHGRTRSSLLANLASSVRSGDPQNIEGQAARAYWSHLFPEEGFIRTPGSGGFRNNCLDYGYTILRGHGIRAVLAAGLNPALGIFHRGRSNAFNLVDDLIEPFRPAIDEVVAHLPIDASPSDRQTKELLVAASTQQFLEDGSTIPTVLERTAQTIGRYFEGDIDKVTIPQWKGPTGVFNEVEDGG